MDGILAVEERTLHGLKVAPEVPEVAEQDSVIAVMQLTTVRQVHPELLGYHYATGRDGQGKESNVPIVLLLPLLGLLTVHCYIGVTRTPM